MQFKSERLQDVVIALLKSRGYTGKRVAEEFGVNPSWLSDFSTGRRTKAAGDDLQRMYEGLTGQPLLK